MGNKEYLEFKVIEEKAKTKVYSIIHKDSEEVLGTIYWYAPWRAYCWESKRWIVWSSGCTKQLLGFVEQLNKDHKRQLQ